LGTIIVNIERNLFVVLAENWVPQVGWWNSKVMAAALWDLLRGVPCAAFSTHSLCCSRVLGKCCPVHF
jgi:hypothetical protein